MAKVDGARRETGKSATSRKTTRKTKRAEWRGSIGMGKEEKKVGNDDDARKKKTPRPPDKVGEKTTNY